MTKSPLASVSVADSWGKPPMTYAIFVVGPALSMETETPCAVLLLQSPAPAKISPSVVSILPPSVVSAVIVSKSNSEIRSVSGSGLLLTTGGLMKTSVVGAGDHVRLQVSVEARGDRDGDEPFAVARVIGRERRRAIQIELRAGMRDDAGDRLEVHDVEERHRQRDRCRRHVLEARDVTEARPVRRADVRRTCTNVVRARRADQADRGAVGGALALIAADLLDERAARR